MGRLVNVEYEDSRTALSSTTRLVSSNRVSQSDETPRNALLAVLPYLGARQLGMMQSTNRTLSMENEAWKLLCNRDFGILQASDAISWKWTYKLAWTEWVVWNEGHPDYVQFLGNQDAQGVWSKTSRNGNTVEVMITM
jgi:hypothetical protein